MLREDNIHLTLLRCPRSSGGSLRSLTASITEERRSLVTFLLGLAEEEDDEDEDEAHLPRLTIVRSPVVGDF